MIASAAFAIASNKIANARNGTHMVPYRTYPAYGERTMRMFESAASILLAVAAQALVVGVMSL